MSNRAFVSNRVVARDRGCRGGAGGFGLDRGDPPADIPVARAVWVARAFTSPATAATLLPASPARAASMVALRASRVFGDPGDQRHHGAAPPGGVGQGADLFIDLAGLLCRVGGHVGAAGHVLTDTRDGARQFLRGAGHAVDIAGGGRRDRSGAGAGPDSQPDVPAEMRPATIQRPGRA